jgi:DNA modification methylase
MSTIKFLQGDCLKWMNKISTKGQVIDVVLTSPPYNTGRPSTSERSRGNHEGRYDIHMDTMTQDEYIDWTIRLFNEFDKILAKDGVILWNISYGSDGTVNKEGIGLVWLVIADIIRKTNFVTADRIIWKKRSALPNNVSKNKLTRIVEDVFVFCRKDEYKTFQCNKEVSQVSKTGQTFYKNVYNFIEAPNNDGANKLNKATYSSELCEKLLTIYANDVNIVYDPFMGTGTTAVACKRLGINCFGSEISKDQVDFSYERLKNVE